MAIRTNYTSDEIFDLMKNKVNEFTLNKPTYWGQGSVSAGFFRAISYFVELLQLQINLAYLSFRVKTAPLGHLLRRIGDFGMTPYSSTYAVSVQKFFGDNTRVSDVLIPAGFQVKTQTVQGDTKFYELLTSVNLPVTDSFITGYCKCTVDGAYGNVASGAINEIVAPLAGITGTINEEVVANGSNAETVEQLRERLPLFLLGLKKGNKDAILDAVYSIEGITLVKIIENHPSNGNFVIYVSTETGIIDAVLLQKIRDKVDSVKGLTVTYSVIAPIVSPITIEFSLNIDSLTYNENDLKQVVLANIKNFINNSKKSIVYIADIISIAKSITGVNNIKNIKINNVADDLTLNEVYVAKINDDNDIIINII